MRCLSRLERPSTRGIAGLRQVPRRRGDERFARASEMRKLSRAAFWRQAARNLHRVPREQEKRAARHDSRRLRKLPSRARPERRRRCARLRELSCASKLACATRRRPARRMLQVPHRAHAAARRAQDVHGGLSRRPQEPPAHGGALHRVSRLSRLARRLRRRLQFVPQGCAPHLGQEIRRPNDRAQDPHRSRHAE
jgi:hypothetical protein